MVSTDDEMAFVLSRGIAQVLANRTAEDASLKTLGVLGTILSLSKFRALANMKGKFAALVATPITAWLTWLAWRRKMRTEADYIALMLMTDASFDPSASVSVMTMMKKVVEGKIKLMRAIQAPEFLLIDPYVSILRCAHADKMSAKGRSSCPREFRRLRNGYRMSSKYWGSCHLILSDLPSNFEVWQLNAVDGKLLWTKGTNRSPSTKERHKDMLSHRGVGAAEHHEGIRAGKH